MLAIRAVLPQCHRACIHQVSEIGARVRASSKKRYINMNNININNINIGSQPTSLDVPTYQQLSCAMRLLTMSLSTSGVSVVMMMNVLP